MINRVSHTIDASNLALGRVATRAATLLMGKHKPSYAPHIDGGDFVAIANYKLIKFTGRKLEQKKYFRISKQLGHTSSETLKSLWQRRPQEVLRRAVWNMLPKNSLRKQMIKRLNISL